MSDPKLMKEILERASEFLEKDLSALQPQDKLTSSIEGLTSLKMMELLLYLEECFGVEFDESAADRLNTLQDLADYIAELRPVAAASDSS